MNLASFFDMGGYAAFVWPSYLVTLALLVINIFTARGAHRRALAEARRRLRRQAERGS
jgi:heme exporter protein D